MGSEDESERDESLGMRCKIQEPLGFVHHDHWWNHDEYKKNCDEYYKKDGGKMVDNNGKINLWIIEWKRFKQATIISLRPTAAIIMLLSNQIDDIGYID